MSETPEERAREYLVGWHGPMNAVAVQALVARVIRDCEGAKVERRWFYPARIGNRGKTLPFTTREPDFVPMKETKRRVERRRTK